MCLLFPLGKKKRKKTKGKKDFYDSSFLSIYLFNFSFLHVGGKRKKKKKLMGKLTVKYM